MTRTMLTSSSLLQGKENLEATPVAIVTENPRLKMNWNGKTICDISREFLNSNGAEKHTVYMFPLLLSATLQADTTLRKNGKSSLQTLTYAHRRVLYSALTQQSVQVLYLCLILARHSRHPYRLGGKAPRTFAGNTKNSFHNGMGLQTFRKPSVALFTQPLLQ